MPSKRDPDDWPMMGIPPRWHVQPGRLILCFLLTAFACAGASLPRVLSGPSVRFSASFRAAISAGIVQAAPSADCTDNTAHLCVFRLGACWPWAFQGHPTQEISCAACPWHAGNFHLLSRLPRPMPMACSTQSALGVCITRTGNVQQVAGRPIPNVVLPNMLAATERSLHVTALREPRQIQLHIVSRGGPSRRRPTVIVRSFATI